MLAAEYPLFRRLCVGQMASTFLSRATVEAAGSWTISPVNAQIYDVHVTFGTYREKIPRGRGVNIDADQWWQEGGTLYFSNTAGRTYLIRYVAAPTAVSSTATTLDIPDEFLPAIAYRLAAVIRTRFDEDPGVHVAAGIEAFERAVFALKANVIGVE